MTFPTSLSALKGLASLLSAEAGGFTLDWVNNKGADQAPLLFTLLSFSEDANEDDRQFVEAGHGYTQNDGTIYVRSWRDEAGGDPHAHVGS